MDTTSAGNGSARVESDPNTGGRARIAGRLVQGLQEPDPLNVDFTVQELRELDLKGQPLYFEHSNAVGRVGDITGCSVDDEGWLWVAAELYSEKERQFSEVPETLRHALRKGELRDLSISYTYDRDPATKRRISPRRFREASLVARGLYKGSHLVAVQASNHSQSLSVEQRLRAPAQPQQHSTSRVSVKASRMQSSDTSAAGGMDDLMDGFDLAKTIESAVQQGIVTQDECKGRSPGQLLQMLAMRQNNKITQTEKLLQTVTTQAKVAQDRFAADQRPHYERFKGLVEGMGIKDEKALGDFEAMMTTVDFAPTGSILAKLGSTLEEERAQLAKERKEREALNLEHAKVSKELQEERERAQLSQPRKRAPEGRFATTPANNGVPATMATGGATATTTTPAAAESASVAASKRSASETRDDETAYARQMRARLEQARTMFPRATTPLETTEVAASELSVAGNTITEHERFMTERILRLRAMRGGPMSS